MNLHPALIDRQRKPCCFDRQAWVLDTRTRVMGFDPGFRPDPRLGLAKIHHFPHIRHFVPCILSFSTSFSARPVPGARWPAPCSRGSCAAGSDCRNGYSGLLRPGPPPSY